MLVWGAVNAKPPAKRRKQVEFKLDYSGGYDKYKTTYWKTFGRRACRTTGPPLAWLVDGVQGARRLVLGASGMAAEAEELRRSVVGPRGERSCGCRTGPAGCRCSRSRPTEATRGTTISSARTRHGKGVYGFGVDVGRRPAGHFGRNIYVDTFDSEYGSGWKRENSLLTHATGGSSVTFRPARGAPARRRQKYRATVIGPGVTPDVMWTGAAPPPTPLRSGEDGGRDPALERPELSAVGGCARSKEHVIFAPPDRHLLRAKDLADARYFEPLERRRSRAAAGLSRAHFSREFRATFGESPHAYLLTRRLERAAALLRTTDRSVADICFSVGLRSVGSFTTSFTRTFGCSPTVYRAAFPPAASHAMVPTCVLRAYGRPQRSTFREDNVAAAG